VSYRFLNKIVSFASDFESVEWTLGGEQSSFELGANAVFIGQHSAFELPSGNILLFDNGDQFSRGLELQLDAQNGTAEVFWEFRPTPDNFAPFISSAVRVANGNTFVAFGTARGSVGEGLGGPIAVYELTPSNRVLWRLEILGQTPSMYRARPLADIAGEVVVP